jgi:Protein of unknown function (DUF3804)
MTIKCKKSKGRGAPIKPPKYCVIDSTEPSKSTSETRSDSSASESCESKTCASLLITADHVRAHLRDYYEDMHANGDCKTRAVWMALYQKYYSPNYSLMRASGNPLSYEGCIDILCSHDFTPHTCDLISLDSVTIIAGGLSAVAVFTIDERFTFKGTKVEDRSVNSAVLEVVNGEIKIAFVHRSTGQPIPKKTRWSAL